MTDENTSPESSASTASSEPAVQKNKMNPMMIVVAIAVIAVIAAVAMFMKGGTSKSDEESVSPANQTTQSVDESTQGAVTNTNGNAVIIKMEAGSFYFKPNVIRAKIGQTVRVELAAVSMQHDFVIDKLGVKSALVPSGQSTTVEFVADTLGEFEFYCSVGNHRQQGMIGTLIVEQ